MMHGHEKSDLVIVAMKPANKAREAHRGGVCGGGRSGVGGAKGGGQGEYAPAKHVLDSEPGSRVTGAGAYTAACGAPRQPPRAFSVAVGPQRIRFSVRLGDRISTDFATVPKADIGSQVSVGTIAAVRADFPFAEPFA